MHAQSLSHVQLFATLCQNPLSIEFSRQEYCPSLTFPTQGGLLDTGVEPESPALASGLFTTEAPGKPS